ncbi:MAG: hypothetical protein K6347_03460 [Campylobacterales bacterium]
MKRLLLTLPLLFVIGWAGEPVSELSQNEACYKTRDMPVGVDELFEGVKKLLMQSNLNIVTVTKQDGVITAKGNQYNDSTTTEITVSISLRPIEVNSLTHIAVIASYNTFKKKSEIGTIGAAGITLPIPVPLTGKYAVVGMGNIENSNWYRAFFASLDKILFEEKMRYIE